MSEFKDHLKEDVTNKDSGLSEKEEYFLDILFTKHKGNFQSAMKEAGFPTDFSVGRLRNLLSKEIKQYARTYIETETARAAIALTSVLEDPNQMGAKNLISASKEILDRGGVAKEDVVSQIPENVIVILPAKKIITNDDN